MSSDDITAANQYRYSAALARDIESKWEKIWTERGTSDVTNPVGKLSGGPLKPCGNKFHVLDMFPYPSGAGLHVGHPLGYIGSDVYARFMRMKGHAVPHPFGFDAFGLPAKQDTRETGQHPATTTTQNIDNMHGQLRRLGLGHEPRREISTADPAYYCWTQWIFLQIFNSWCDPVTGRARPIENLIGEFEAGIRKPVSPANPDGLLWRDLDTIARRRVVDSYRLAYLEETPVNWCPSLGTVLSNEEVTTDGRSDVGNYPVYRRRMRQWMLRITAFADRLLEDLDPLDWSDSLKLMQRNWIGRSEGADVYFTAQTPHGAKRGLEVYTTRPDTLFGVTFLVLAPEHPLVDELTTSEWPVGTSAAWCCPSPSGGPTGSPREAVNGYVRWASSLSDRQRQAQTTKTAVFTGSYAINPVSGEQVPIFIADYVLANDGSGVVMAVPAHDQRDYEWAVALDLPLRAVVDPGDTWLAAHASTTTDDPANWGEAFEGVGTAINSASADISLTGLPAADAQEKILRWLESTGRGARRTSYRLRDWLFSRQRYWGEPFPIVYDETGLPIALPESMLPVELPPMADFRAQPIEGDEPKPPLSRAPGFEYVDVDLGEGTRVYRRETNTMPQWAGSCWYYLRYLDPTNDEQFVDPEAERYWIGSADGVERIGEADLHIGGVEHAVLSLLYARFWHKILFDLGHMSAPEPFQQLCNQGYILADAFTNANGRYVPAAEVTATAGEFVCPGESVPRIHGKMSKSLTNAVSPDDIYDSYGADTLCMYEMARGPLNVDRPWQPDDIVGVFRLLQRLWRNIINEQTGKPKVSDGDLPPAEPLFEVLHRTIDSVDRLYTELRYNVAVARITELNNALSRYVQHHGASPRQVAEALVLMVFPLAPHVTSELWEKLGHNEAIDDARFPTADPDALVQSYIIVPVTVNGKPRGEIIVNRHASETEVTSAGLALEKVAKLVEDKEIVRVVVVPEKIVNFVIR
jgi:leucyl-tRNA synthetase